LNTSFSAPRTFALLTSCKIYLQIFCCSENFTFQVTPVRLVAALHRRMPYRHVLHSKAGSSITIAIYSCLDLYQYQHCLSGFELASGLTNGSPEEKV
jgi:hypothetical protein